MYARAEIKASRNGFSRRSKQNEEPLLFLVNISSIQDASQTIIQY